MSRHKKTREQKIMADQRLKNFAYTFESKNLSIALPKEKAPSAKAVILNPTYSDIGRDVSKTLILTLSIIALQIFLFLILKNHVLKIPGIVY